MTGGAALSTDGVTTTRGITVTITGMATMAMAIMDIRFTDTITITAITAGTETTTETNTATGIAEADIQADTQADILPIVPATLENELIITDLRELTTAGHQEVL